MPKVHPAVKLMRRICNSYKGFDWQVNNILTTQKLQYKDEWTAYTFIPERAWTDITKNLLGYKFIGLAENYSDIVQITVLGTWRYSQKIYNFNTELTEALARSEQNQEIPVDALLKLPDYCCYIELNKKINFDGFGDLNGFFVKLCYAANEKRTYLCIHTILDNYEYFTDVFLPLIKGKTISQALNDMMENALSSVYKNKSNAEQKELMQLYKIKICIAKSLIPYILYLCSNKPDILNPVQPDYINQGPKPIVLHDRQKLSPPKTPTILEVGSVIGEQLRKSREEKERIPAENSGTCRKGPKGHIRRGHWHSYWTGPRTGQQEIKLHWLPPFLVNVKAD